MKTLKRGRKQKGASKEYVCSGNGNGGGGCGGTLLVSQHDIYYNEHHNSEDGYSYSYFFTCHDCGTETKIPDPGFRALGTRPSCRSK